MTVHQNGFANTKAGQDREEALRVSNLEEKKRQDELRNKQTAPKAAKETR